MILRPVSGLCVQQQIPHMQLLHLQYWYGIGNEKLNYRAFSGRGGI